MGKGYPLYNTEICNCQILSALRPMPLYTIFMKITTLKITTALLIITATLTVGCQNPKNENKMSEQNNTAIFPKGELLTNGYFTGQAYLSPLLARDKNNEFAMGNVTFEAGARTN